MTEKPTSTNQDDRFSFDVDIESLPKLDLGFCTVRHLTARQMLKVRHGSRKDAMNRLFAAHAGMSTLTFKRLPPDKQAHIRWASNQLSASVAADPRYTLTARGWVRKDQLKQVERK